MEVTIGYHVEYALKILIEASWRGRQCELERFRLSNEIRVPGLDNPVPVPRSTDPLLFLNNYCTIKLGTARGSGHTTALLSATRLFTLPIVLFPNVSMAHHALRFSCPKNDNARLLSFRQLNYARGLDYDSIMVDCSFMLGSSELNSITGMCTARLSRCPERFCLIFVG